MKKNTQLELPFPVHGGKRRGAGRKPKGKRAGVPHRVREKVSRHHPVHVTAKIARGLPNLRTNAGLALLRRAFAEGCSRESFKLVHYSIQNDHVHMIVEVDDRSALTKGMQGLMIRMARGLNKIWQRSGNVFADRYHSHVLRTPREVKHAIRYVLMNAKKHGIRLAKSMDPFSPPTSHVRQLPSQDRGALLGAVPTIAFARLQKGKALH